MYGGGVWGERERGGKGEVEMKERRRRRRRGEGGGSLLFIVQSSSTSLYFDRNNFKNHDLDISKS